jgi:predicted DNA-binding transcriptional regulator AlpA
MHQLPEVGFLRLPQIIGDTKRGIPAIVPVSKSTWWAGVKSGRYPAAVKLSARTTAWPVESIRALIEQAAEAGKPRQPLTAS